STRTSSILDILSPYTFLFFFFFNYTPTTEIYTLSLHDALPIYAINNVFRKFSAFHDETGRLNVDGMNIISNDGSNKRPVSSWKADRKSGSAGMPRPISYAVFCLKKKKRVAEYDCRRLTDTIGWH